MFKDLTVLENVAIALQQNVPYNLFASLFHLPPYGRASGGSWRRAARCWT
ncbi:hypothetical protein [Tessaracoccus coleopterorum]